MIKWKKRVKRDWQEGDTRIVRRFLFWPVCIEDEWRWLGTSIIRQKLERRLDCKGDVSFWALRWVNREWVDGR